MLVPHRPSGRFTLPSGLSGSFASEAVRDGLFGAMQLIVRHPGFQFDPKDRSGRHREPRTGGRRRTARSAMGRALSTIDACDPPFSFCGTAATARLRGEARTRETETRLADDSPLVPLGRRHMPSWDSVRALGRHSVASVPMGLAAVPCNPKRVRLPRRPNVSPRFEEGNEVRINARLRRQ